jgi:hypothetical protein
MPPTVPPHAGPPPTPPPPYAQAANHSPTSSGPRRGWGGPRVNQKTQMHGTCIAAPPRQHQRRGPCPGAKTGPRRATGTTTATGQGCDPRRCGRTRTAFGLSAMRRKAITHPASRKERQQWCCQARENAHAKGWGGNKMTRPEHGRGKGPSAALQHTCTACTAPMTRGRSAWDNNSCHNKSNNKRQRARASHMR